jgi:hypothetical protein
MARVTHSVVDVQGPYPVGTISANAADITFTAADVANKEQCALDYPVIVLCWNTDGANPYTVTFDTVTETAITAYSIGAGELAAFEFRGHGWKQSDGYLHFEANNAAIKFAVLKKG